MLEAGADVSLTSNGRYPLIAACDAGNIELINLLLKSGADVKCRTSSNKTYLHAVANLSCIPRDADDWKTADKAAEARPLEDMLSIVRLLLQHGVNVNDVADKGDTALYRACVSEQLAVVHVLLETGADVNLTSNRLYPLMAACKAGNIELINLLVVAGADMKCRKSNNETCLHVAVNPYSSSAGSQKHADVVPIIKSFLESGVDVNERSSRGETALYLASKAGHEHIVRLLLEAGAETNCSSRIFPLHAACEHGHTEIVDLLLHHGADPNASPVFGDLPIGCAVQKCYTNIVSLLLKHGADVNTQDRRGKSAVTYCMKLLAFRIFQSQQVSNPREERILNIWRSLMLAGGDVFTEYRGVTTLHIASYFGLCDVMSTLIQCGVDCSQLTSSGKSALDFACKGGHEVAVELLLKSGAHADRKLATTRSNLSGQSLIQVLCTAAKHGNATIVKMLLKHGVSVNEVDNQGNTALHLTTSAAVIETLLNAGANVNARNSDGQTALCVACVQQQTDADVVQMLLKFGADPNISSA